MNTATELVTAYWPLAALAAVLVLVLLVPVRGFLRRSAVPAPVPDVAPEPPPPPTPVQRLAASIEQAARERARAQAPVPTTVLPPRPSSWAARAAAPAPEVAAVPEPPPSPPPGQRRAAPKRRHRAFGRPPGLGAPRPGGRDDLKDIHGIGPRIERGLNQLGVYHYDQIAAWDPRMVIWVETWFSLRGCIARERWVEQARTLAAPPSELRSLRRPAG